ncbi:uncharacterized protein I206_105695 [Kwoniella pini CBS 10737]|uniref:TRP C-terminal domain-containing protein n=1 Tax=Kwoniella pini CBS 10737 TaxID=1296096 RepID=A0A1B9I3I0_9TREE|nr:uncharacterized protein I206_03402 [Kwoniella pini CBS 10737]OCF50085.1 hypothetical protein I206_03402 [Kwoniella pini CBS 10737]
MLSTLISILPYSLLFLWTSYGSTKGNFKELSNLIKYKSNLWFPNYLKEDNYGSAYDKEFIDFFFKEIWIDIKGKCYLRGINEFKCISKNNECKFEKMIKEIECTKDILGNWIFNLIPFLTIYLQTFYSILTYSIILCLCFNYLIKNKNKNKWLNKKELKFFRKFILLIMILKDFIGIFGLIICLISLLFPLLDSSINHIVNIKIGLGIILNIFTVFGSILLTVQFKNWSKILIEQQPFENGIILDEESISIVEKIPNYIVSSVSRNEKSTIVESKVENEKGDISKIH